jgi:hypothetical protein
VRELFAQEQHHRRKPRGHPDARFVLLVEIQQKLAAIRMLPVGIQVGDEGQHAIGLSLERIQVAPVEITRRVMSKMALEREQPEQQAAVEVILKSVAPLKPFLSGIRVTIDPADFIAAHEIIDLVLLVSPDASPIEL